MLTYTFSTREKVLLAVLAFAAIIVAWYQLVFVSIQNEIASIDAQIATISDELVISQARTASLNSMREVVEAYEQQGIQPVLLPAFDNTQNLMAYLNGVLAGTKGYSMSFDNPTLSEDDGAVHRSGTISFGSGSYAQARSVVQSIARGPYPCQIDSLGITDNTQAGTNASSSGNAEFTCNVQITFFETAPSGTSVSSGDEEAQGQDLSQMSNWNQ